jgi:hypothetical protein
MIKKAKISRVRVPLNILTLIGPGEVKVDLADFDLKLRENLLSNLILKKNLFLQKRLPSLFELLT